jgi:hypothetical protein
LTPREYVIILITSSCLPGALAGGYFTFGMRTVPLPS